MNDTGVDVLITHGPPLGRLFLNLLFLFQPQQQIFLTVCAVGHGDLCTHGGRAGCLHLLDSIEKRIKPKFHIFGHIHEGYGCTTNGETIFVNASTCNYNYNRNALNPAIVFDLPNKV